MTRDGSSTPMAGGGESEQSDPERREGMFRPTRRRLLGLLGTGAVAMAGCQEVPSDCGFEIRLALSEDTTVDAGEEFALDGTVRVSFTDLVDDAVARSVAVVLAAEDGDPIARTGVGDVAQADGESYDEGTCEGDRVTVPVTVTAETTPELVTLTCERWPRYCEAQTGEEEYDAPAIHPREYVPPEGSPAGELGEWDDRRRRCPGTETGTTAPSTASETTRPANATTGETPTPNGTAGTPTTPSPNGTAEETASTDDAD